jgi:hypothetical protein
MAACSCTCAVRGGPLDKVRAHACVEVFRGLGLLRWLLGIVRPYLESGMCMDVLVRFVSKLPSWSTWKEGSHDPS